MIRLFRHDPRKADISFVTQVFICWVLRDLSSDRYSHHCYHNPLGSTTPCITRNSTSWSRNGTLWPWEWLNSDCRGRIRPDWRNSGNLEAAATVPKAARKTKNGEETIKVLCADPDWIVLTIASKWTIRTIKIWIETALEAMSLYPSKILRESHRSEATWKMQHPQMPPSKKHRFIYGRV